MNAITEKFLPQMLDKSRGTGTMYGTHLSLSWFYDFTFRIIIKVIPKDRCEGSMAVSTGLQCHKCFSSNICAQEGMLPEEEGLVVRLCARSCLLLRGLWTPAIMRPAMSIFMVENESRCRLCRIGTSNLRGRNTLDFAIPQPLSTKNQTILSSEFSGSVSEMHLSSLILQIGGWLWYVSSI